MTKDLTQGKITPLLVKFTIPLLFGNIFQLMYNSVDSIIVGQLVGKEALAAVGTSNPLMTLAILFVNGMCIGASILMGTQYGAKKMDVLKRQISTTMIAGIVFSITVTLFCILFARPLLLLIRVQEEVLPLAVPYLRIVFLGFIFTFIYNFFACTLRALGDSTTPLYFLVASSVLNIIGDLFFVAVLRWGSMGCAVATVVSEAVCCMLCIIYIKRKVPELNLGKAWFVFDGSLLKQTILYGWTSAMQQGTVQLGKIGVQAIANTMGVSVMAAYTIVNRIDDFACLPEQNIAHSMTSFMAQNSGAGKKERVRKGFWGGMKIELVYGMIIFLVCFFFAEPIVRLFVSDTDVVKEGVTYLKLISFMYLLPAVTNGIQGYFRGIGDLKITLISSMVNMGVRVLAAFVFVFGFAMKVETFQIVGADGEEVALLRQLVRDEDGGRRLDHGAHFHLLVELLALCTQLGAALVQHGLGVLQLPQAGDHGEHDAHVAVGRSPQQRTQLGLEEVLPGQTDADGAVAQCGVVLVVQLHVIHGLVRADVFSVLN